ncbi:LacI family transcriptional regulator [Plantibacter flavus]|uniref:LacI family DNA-binding transcriptional regulator n=1 Tax=Plantibacter flavus TaxID=150123 RepID=UPI003F18B8BB
MPQKDETPEDAKIGKKAPPTIYDVATEAGVSASTVSRALNRPGRLNIRTEERVRLVAEALGYRTNPIARALPTGRIGTLALVLSDITNPVYFDLIRSAEQAAARRGNTLVVAESQESPATELETAERLQPSVDGLILVASRLTDTDIVELNELKPVILVNREVPGIPSVIPDVRPGMRDALAHLVALGHRSIAYVSGPRTSWMSSHRWTVLRALTIAAGLPLREIGPAAPTLDGGAELLQRIVTAEATAVMTYNDLMALGLLRAAQAQGLAIPGRLSVVGFDDIFGADLTTPALSTIRSPLTELGAHAVELFCEPTRLTVEGPALGTRFIPRQSTGAPD